MAENPTMHPTRAAAILRRSALAPEWSARLAGFDVYAWDQCYAMEQSLRIE